MFLSNSGGGWQARRPADSVEGDDFWQCRRQRRREIGKGKGKRDKTCIEIQKDIDEIGSKLVKRPLHCARKLMRKKRGVKKKDGSNCTYLQEINDEYRRVRLETCLSQRRGVGSVVEK